MQSHPSFQHDASAMNGSRELGDTREVLAQFADEPARMPLSLATINRAVPALVRVAATDDARTRPLPLLDPRASFVPVLWTVLIGCLSAMAFGASFAIGFNYIDSPNPAMAIPIETFPLRPPWHGSLLVPYRSSVESERPESGNASPSGSKASRIKPATPAPRRSRRTFATLFGAEGRSPGGVGELDSPLRRGSHSAPESGPGLPEIVVGNGPGGHPRVRVIYWPPAGPVQRLEILPLEIP